MLAMNRRSEILSVLGLLSAVGFACGCESPGFTSKKAQSPVAARKDAVGQTTTTNAPMPIGEAANANAPPIQTSGLTVSDAIARACGIPPRADGGQAAASFEFDSTALGADDRQMLALVAKCLTDGALRGRGVTLVGRADPRGEAEYNMTLGESRADAVHRYLVDLGVGRDRLRATSRGEIDATGRDEAGWATDRRVDITLAN